MNIFLSQITAIVWKDFVTELKTRELFGAVRVAVTGSSAAPPLFDTLAAVGRERVLRRLEQAAERLSEES